MPPHPAVPTEEVCVSALSSRAAEAIAAARAIDPLVAQTRAALIAHHTVDADPALVRALVDYVPVPAPRARMAVRASAAVDPVDPSHGWLTVDGATALGRSEVPLVLTVMVDVSGSMSSGPVSAVPVLQRAEPDGKPYTVDRLELASAVLDGLAERLPARAMVSLAVFERARALTVLPPTPASDREALAHAFAKLSDDAVDERGRPTLDVARGLAVSSTDGCADRRVLLVTDDKARFDLDQDVVADALADWAARGIELWTLSLGTKGAPVPQMEAYTAAGRGVLVRADTVSEATEPLAGALRATGTSARAPAIEVAFGPDVASWRRVDGGGDHTGTDRWDLPERLDSGWRASALYELTFAQPIAGSPSAPVATVTWSASSPVPGDWQDGAGIPVAATALADADAALRDRVFAVALGRTLSGQPSTIALGRARRLVHGDGPAYELTRWVDLLPPQ